MTIFSRLPNDDGIKIDKQQQIRAVWLNLFYEYFETKNCIDKNREFFEHRIR